MTVRAYATDSFTLSLPERHRFPMQKYARLAQRVREEVPEIRLFLPPAATDAQLVLAHDEDYVRRVAEGGLSDREIRVMGFPWSEDLVQRSRRSTGATIAGARAALADGVSINLAGGTHHAGRARGQGYCVFNDAAVAARVMQQEGRVERVLVIDVDVHQGNGTAEICADDPSIFTLSVHGARNFPFRKAMSDLDVALADETGDDAYVDALNEALDSALRVRPQLAIVNAGADPYEGDRLGRLSLSKEGIRRRDACIRERLGDTPMVVTMGGGYAPDVEDIVAIHLQTILTLTGLSSRP